MVRFLHLAMGLAMFGSAAVLARRVGSRRSSSLVLLGLAAFPIVCLQLKQTYVDVPAALLVTAAAAEIAASRDEPRRVWLAGFLFGAAVATKFFALLGGVALLVLLIRRRRGGVAVRVLSFALCAAIPLVPWLVWSQSRTGFFLSPYSDAWRKPAEQKEASWSELMGQDSAAAGPRSVSGLSEAGTFLRLPYDLTFHAARFRTNGGYVGLLPLLLTIGVLGWDGRRLGLFCLAALAALLPWHAVWSLHAHYPSIRYLIPVYPLYAVFAAHGLETLTANFEGWLGACAGLSMAALSIAFPAQFLSVPFDAEIAIGRVSREQALAAYLPSYPLWSYVRPEDRVLFFGEWDRYHCPAADVVRDYSLPASLDQDAKLWLEEMRRRSITHIVYRSDQRRLTALLSQFGDCIQIIDRHQTASLYRVDWPQGNCSAPAAESRGALPSPQDSRGSKDPGKP